MGCCCKKKNEIYISNKVPLKSEEEQKITQKDFEKVKIIGKGSFGNVYLVRHIKTDKFYAMKVFIEIINKTKRRRISYNIRKNINGQNKFSFNSKTSLLFSR